MTLPDVATSHRCELLAPGDPPACAESLLLTLGYGTDATDFAATGAPCLTVPNRVLAPAATVEVWRSVHDVRRGRRGGLAWSEDGEILAGCLQRRPGADLAADTRSHFRELLELLENRGYPNLLRVWNYLPRINDGDLDRENYRLFNTGRARAFAERRDRTGRFDRFPASSAVGTPGEELRTAFLASALPPIDLENPRQTSAYRYPSRYGPQPPSFSRATLASNRLREIFFLSGTASIVGHETRHHGAVHHQLAETLRNIESLIERARRVSGRRIPPLDEFDLIKVYLRHPRHLETVRSALGRAIRPETPVLYLEADICRADLLIEIEGQALI